MAASSLLRQPICPVDPPLVRMPPCSVEAERAFLGALLANNKVHDRALFLQPQHFADPINGKIFHEARQLIEQRRIADTITLKTVLESSGALAEVGGTEYLSNLLVCMVGIINATDYAKVVQQKWMCRELIDIGETLVNEAFGGFDPVDPVELAAQTIAMIDTVLAGAASQTNAVSLGDAVNQAMVALDEAMRSGRSAGVSTGFRCFDERLGGLEGGQSYVLGGRPGQGKSALGHKIGVNIARRGLEEGFGVVEWALEMTAKQMGQRTLSAAADVPLRAIKTGSASQSEVDRLVMAQRELQTLPMTIDDTAGQTPRMLAAKARALKRKYGRLGLIILDHLNLTRPDGDDGRHGPTHVIERASGAMLQIAKDNDVPVLVLVQLNRGVESREDKRPTLADLRQSGAIEQDAYAVGFVYREEYYLRNNEPEQKDGETADALDRRLRAFRERQDKVAGQADVIWQKVRDGDPGTDRLFFDGRTANFREERS